MAGFAVSYRLWLLISLILASALCATVAKAEPVGNRDPLPPLLPGFRRSPWFDEQIREEWFDRGVRVLINASADFDTTRPTELIIYATPNGNTIEQTLGSKLLQGTDWHFDIQHVAAQTRRLRAMTRGNNIVLACVQTEERSWPSWRWKNLENAALIRAIVDRIKAHVTGMPIKVTLSGHSGGGSFIFGFLNGSEEIPKHIQRIAFLDANYAYSDADNHGKKLLAWLRKDKAHHLDVISYDDRNIMLDGRKVVGPDGGTFRASQRMIDFFRKTMTLSDSRDGDFTNTAGMGGQILFRLHANPENKILHTALVGEMNGFLAAMTSGTPRATGWGKFGGPRTYSNWVQPAAGVPPRPADTVGGTVFIKQSGNLTSAAWEQAIASEIRRGNIPDFLRAFQSIDFSVTDASGSVHKVVIEAMPDYLAVGSDQDFVRAPLTPMAAQRIADAFGCVLPTRRIVDVIYQKAAVKLEPRPLTVDREATGTFVQHNTIIEEQRAGRSAGLLVAGIKKDVVLSNRLSEKPNRVAIYGWHKPDGLPIQPLTIVHKDTYVDYSHGIRLLRRTVLVDDKPRDIRDVLRDPVLSAALSDEGPILRPTY